MKVILYMAMTANGMIAKENDDTSWVSKKEWKNFSRMIKKAGNMIIGRKTYEIMKRNHEFSKLPGVQVVVLSRKTLRPGSGFFSAASPQSALDILRSEGLKTIMVCGGGMVNTSFIQQKLIDEIYLDVEPIVLGKGIPLFSKADFQAKLRLKSIKKVSRDEIQLQYRVLH